MKKKTYAELYADYRRANYPDSSAVMAIYDYVTSQYHTAKRITKSVLRKELGSENFLKLSATDVNPDIAWLVHSYAQLDGFEKDFVKFKVELDNSETKRYKIPVSLFMGVSDRDFAKQVRYTLKNPIHVKGYCIPSEQWGAKVSNEVLLEILEALKS